MKRSLMYAVGLLLAIGSLSCARAQEITVMISGGFSAALDSLAPAYERETGNTLNIVHGPSMGNSPDAIPRRLANGQKADAAIMVGYALDKLIEQGAMATGSRTELADSRIGAVVRSGAPVPDISTVPKLRAALLQAKSIAYSDSASGRYVQSRLFKILGIDAQVQAKAKMIEKTPVASAVANGQYQIGFQQVSELLPITGAHFIGRIPEPVQYVTRFAGAVVKGAAHDREARQMLAWLSSVQAREKVKRSGLDPVTSAADTSR